MIVSRPSASCTTVGGISSSRQRELGKTVIAALDYRRLRDQLGGNPTLLFVAHRKEILEQSLRTFREVLGDPEFGELSVGGERPGFLDPRLRLSAGTRPVLEGAFGEFGPDHFDVVIVDEFHHAAAATYERLLEHVRPRVLLGLTATPERADGGDILRWFDGHVAAEMRVWEALERDLLTPFHYFGVSDGTDLSAVAWRRGGYERRGVVGCLYRQRRPGQDRAARDQRTCRLPLGYAGSGFLRQQGTCGLHGTCVPRGRARCRAPRFRFAQ